MVGMLLRSRVALSPTFAVKVSIRPRVTCPGSSSRSASMQPMTADDRPNILADIKRDHAQFFGLHRRFKEELGLSHQDQQVLIWQVKFS